MLIATLATLLTSCAPAQVLYPSTDAIDAAWKKVREAEAPFIGLVKNDRLKVHWLDADRLWYQTLENGTTQYTLANASKGLKSPAFDHNQLAMNQKSLLTNLLSFLIMNLKNLIITINGKHQELINHSLID